MSEIEKLKALLVKARQQMVAVHHKYACDLCSEDESGPNCPCGMQELAAVVDLINAVLDPDEDEAGDD
jgi:hypothetical protein